MTLTHWCERTFRLAEHRTTVRTELLAGLTTFLTMAYIIVVQPAILSGALFGRPTDMGIPGTQYGIGGV